MRGTVAADGVGVAGVVCSDGRTVVRTGADGGFDIEVGGPFVFICTPTGYATERWFLPSDGALDFELRQQPQPVPFSFAQITDLHLSLREWVFGQPVAATPEVTTAVLDEIVRAHPDLAFIVSTGDQTNDGTDEEFAAYTEIIERVPLRVVAIAGNHDHNSVDIDDARRRGESYGPGVLLTPYDRHLGPRWFSFDHGGVHFVAIDWTTYHMGLEVGVQEEWVRADLACVDPSTPVIFLTHDLMSSAFFSGVGAPPVASFSGHWHTTRVVRSGGALHVNSSPLTFGGLDYSPAHWRIATWNGEEISIDTHSPRPRHALRTSDDVLWSAALTFAAHRGGCEVSQGLVIATSGSEESPAGTIEAFDVASGKRCWRVGLSSAVKTAPLICGDRVVASAVTGETVCVDLRTGAERWRTEIDDPLRLWTYLRPATDGRSVFVGDTARFVALDLDDGSIVWQRDDLGSRGNITCHSHPVVVDGTLVVSFAAQIPDMWGLDAATGATLWPEGVTAANVYDIAAPDRIVHLMRMPVSAFSRDPNEPDVYVVRLSNVVDRIRVADGTVVWSSMVAGWTNPAAPVVDGDDVIVCEGRGTVWCLARDDGSVRWTTEVTTESPLHMGPYRNDGGALFGEAALTKDALVVACGDGRVVMLARADGSINREWALGVPFAAPPTIATSTCIVVGTDGVLRALAL